ncbi:MAG: hypothetical protein AAGE94_13260, partial [Acidobacteriota bacterium]
VRILVVGGLVYVAGVLVDFGDSLVANLSAQAILAGVVYPGLLLASGFLQPGERRVIAKLVRKYAPWMLHDAETVEDDTDDAVASDEHAGDDVHTDESETARRDDVE